MNTIDSALTNTLMMSFHTDNIILKMLYNTLILGIVAYISKSLPSILEYFKLCVFTTNKYTSIHYTSTNTYNNNINRSIGFSAWLEYYNEEGLKNALNTNEKYNVKEIQGGYVLNCHGKYQGAFLIPDNVRAYKINDFAYITHWKENVHNNANMVSMDHIVVSTNSKNQKKLLKFDIELRNKYAEKQFSIYNTAPHIFTFLSYKNGKVQWRTRKFISHRTMDHIWFNKKTDFLEKYNMFLNNKEDYIKRGEPWTFSCMLHGMPGCGKTSLLKSIVNMDKKNGKISHLFIIPFSNIDTAEVFSSIILGEENENINIPHDQRIYIFEDFDACQYSNIFLKREYVKTEEVDNKSDKDELSDDELDNELDNNNILPIELSPLAINSIKQQFNGFSHSKIISPKSHKKKEEISSSKKVDPINLSSILNTLDGLIERTGQRIFWTTNKDINIFDPAFLRPGRMDMIIEFTPCNTEGAIYLLEKYYDKKVDSSFKLKHDITPAKLKELCRSSITIDECVQKINNLEY